MTHIYISANMLMCEAIYMYLYMSMHVRTRILMHAQTYVNGGVNQRGSRTQRQRPSCQEIEAGVLLYYRIACSEHCCDSAGGLHCHI